MDICEISSCTACGACLNICPRKSIIFKKDYLGRKYATINATTCIKCNLCKKVCPTIKSPEMSNTKKVYASWSKNKEDTLLCSSGGIATGLSRCFIKDGGIVVGASFIEKKVEHIIINQEDDLYLIRGSKYVESDTGNTFYKIKEYLKNDLFVLFIGTPCQIAGLKNYLHFDYDNLLLIDIICHGVVPFDYLNDHLNSISKEWTHANFRGEFDFKLTLYNNKQLVKQFEFFEDEYYKAFFDGLIFRENCYSCKYSCPKRLGDITIGDYWGLNKKSLLNKYEGKISVVLINTDKGNKYFNKYKNEFFYEERDINEPFCEEQTNLLHPTPIHKDRKLFEEQYISKGFDKAVMSTSLGKSLKVQKIKRLFKKNIFTKYIYDIYRNIKQY
ncbi:Coenzyme F420 hydrogenase/dehydrogenase, beta subunit C-terminal domain [Longibaculum muris]|uniref:Coenzyme F420 hydrogenase/dehydrogenase, beta subunit C-terminal domain n=1 Tax=Longibaculum muris TaxID=1796628 RepID=UPI0022E32627|nr:Coenzyme F420 hydrogenase/dehydrogenase, beta subunit C-terminal domain [Longibaculum muris]